MAYEGVKIRELVDRAVAHSWSIPEFQRGFVWKSTQVRDLLESLWLDYPIGSLLVWNSGGPRGGGNYQTLINKALREHIESGKKPTLEETLRRVIREELRTSP
ncbi:MAG: DUF262 domain-containing protein [Terriglobia bacterium]